MAVSITNIEGKCKMYARGILWASQVVDEMPVEMKLKGKPVPVGTVCQ